MPNNTPPVNIKELDLEVRRAELRATLITQLLCADPFGEEHPAPYVMYLSLQGRNNEVRHRIQFAAKLVDTIIDEATK